MKVYIVFECEADWSEPIGAFSSLELAKAYCAHKGYTNKESPKGVWHYTKPTSHTIMEDPFLNKKYLQQLTIELFIQEFELDEVQP